MSASPTAPSDAEPSRPDPRHVLRSALHRARWRKAVADAWRGTESFAVILPVVAAALLLVLTELDPGAAPLMMPIAAGTLTLVLLALATRLLFALWNSAAPNRVAWELDRRLGLRDAFTTSVEVASASDPGLLGATLLERTAASLDGRRVASAFPLLWLRPAWVASALLLAGVLLLPLWLAPPAAQNVGDSPSSAAQEEAKEGKTPGIKVDPVRDLITDERGRTDRFTVVLETPPAGDVTITLMSSDKTEGSVSPSSLTFTPENAATPQTVTVTGMDDMEVDGDQKYLIFTDPASSTDANYDGLDPADVSVMNLDDDKKSRGAGGVPVEEGSPEEPTPASPSLGGEKGQGKSPSKPPLLGDPERTPAVFDDVEVKPFFGPKGKTRLIEMEVPIPRVTGESKGPGAGKDPVEEMNRLLIRYEKRAEHALSSGRIGRGDRKTVLGYFERVREMLNGK
ncbi:MAG: hypothetical protein ACYS47_01455 [Planctomycetota bacterium]|jgi:hypothetical protein